MNPNGAHQTQLALLLFLSFSVSLNSHSGNEAVYVTDVVFLQQGKTFKQARSYYEVIDPIILKHGLIRKTPPIEMVQELPFQARKVVNIWMVSDPENTFDRILSDPEFLALQTLRNNIFDQTRSEIFLTKQFVSKI